MDDKLSIKVNIADRYYPLKVERNDEEKIRKAARLINDKVLQYRQRFSDKDLVDFMAMASLQFVTKVLEMEEQADNTDFYNEIKQIETDIYTFIETK
ncbi:MAG TPA: cell division protein ZapA [Bacteroidales bacterium]|nr:cell division protein ZapA [Bacteroidales bacterium]